jgi:hypothetical protein
MGRGEERRKTVTREDGGGDTTTRASTPTSGSTSAPLPPQPAGYARTTTRIRTLSSRAGRSSPARDDVVQREDDDEDRDNVVALGTIAMEEEAKGG